jgi:hypothetical protein
VGVRTSKINLHIEELVLHGFAPGDRYTIADAVERELSRLLAENFADPDFSSLLTSNTEAARLDAGAFQVDLRSQTNSIGTQIAQAVHGELTK